MGSGAGWPGHPCSHPRPRGAGGHLDFDLVPRDVHVDPRLEGLVLHALAHGLPHIPRVVMNVGWISIAGKPWIAVWSVISRWSVWFLENIFLFGAS